MRAFPAHAPGWLKWVVLGILALVYACVQGQYICRVDSQMVALEPIDLELMRFLESLSKGALVAGHPMDMDNVPLLARRKVLSNHELSLPYYLRYYDRVRRRITESFQAYYATRWETVEAFVERYGIDALVVRKEHFQKPFLAGRIYYEPFNAAVKAQLSGGGRLVLKDPPRNHRCFENDRYIVLCFGHLPDKTLVRHEPGRTRPFFGLERTTK
jgi:hypothetical protein